MISKFLKFSLLYYIFILSSTSFADINNLEKCFLNPNSNICKQLIENPNKIKNFDQLDNVNLCDKALDYLFWPDKRWSKNSLDIKYVKEAKSRGLDCGVGSSNNNVVASKPKTQAYTKPKSTISSAELDASKREADELRKKLASLQSKQKQEQQKIDTDNQIPTISAFTKQNGSNATISGRVTDNTEVAEVLIDGEQLSLTNNGTFKTELYIPRNGLNIEIVAYDRKGNKASKLLKIERGNIQQASGPVFDTLNPSGKTGPLACCILSRSILSNLDALLPFLS